MLEDVLSRGLRGAGADQRHEADAQDEARPARPAGTRTATTSRSASRSTTTTRDPARGGARRAAAGSRRIDGLVWLAPAGFAVHVAGRRVLGRDRGRGARRLSPRLFAEHRHRDRRGDPGGADAVPGDGRRASTCRRSPTACWGILNKSPDSVMCASARMVVKRKGAAAAGRRSPAPCCPTTRSSSSARTLAESVGAVPLNHPHCAKFCVLGGAACSQ